MPDGVFRVFPPSMSQKTPISPQVCRGFFPVSPKYVAPRRAVSPKYVVPGKAVSPKYVVRHSPGTPQVCRTSRGKSPKCVALRRTVSPKYVVGGVSSIHNPNGRTKTSSPGTESRSILTAIPRVCRRWSGKTPQVCRTGIWDRFLPVSASHLTWTDFRERLTEVRWAHSGWTDHRVNVKGSRRGRAGRGTPGSVVVA